MDARYIKNLPAISAAEQEQLKMKKILIAGCGGLGSYLFEYALRLGVGSIRIMDGDCFKDSNLNRQLLADSGSTGTFKVLAAADRAKRVNPLINVEVFTSYIDRSNAFHSVFDCDAVLDALDNVKSRKLLLKACQKANVPYIYGSVSGWTAQAALIMPEERGFGKLLNGSFADMGILPFTPALCAAMESAICLRLLCGRQVESGKLYCMDLLNMDFENPLIK